MGARSTVGGGSCLRPTVCMEGRALVFVTALVFVILTELSAAVTQPHGPHTCLKELEQGIPKKSRKNTSYI